MNCSRPSDARRTAAVLRSPDGARRSRIGGLALLLAVTAVIVGAGCKDELAAPTHGVVEITLSSPTAGGHEGTRVLMDGTVLIDAAGQTRYEFVLPAGEIEFTAEKECARLSPVATQQVTVPPGGRVTVNWTVEPGSAIEVVSNMPGASIRLDGENTGRVTPTTLTCIEPGPHTVSVSLLGAEAGPDSSQVVQVGADPVRVDFTLEPQVQPRTVLMEIFTATYCPNCAPADAAAVLLWDDPGPENGYIGIQVHTRWGGRDSLATTTTLERNAFYGNQESQGIPAAIFGGTLLDRGTQGAETPAIAERYRGHITELRAIPTPFALHWLAADRTPEVAVTGRVRLVLTGSVDDSDDWRIWGAIYKDELHTTGIEGPNQEFRHNVRTFLDKGTLTDLSLSAAGDYVDLDLEFPLGWDRRRSGSVWSEEAMGLVVFVQNMGTKEIAQAAHIVVP